MSRNDKYALFDPDTAEALLSANEEIARLDKQHRDGIKAVQARLDNHIKGKIVTWRGNAGNILRGRIVGIVEWAGMFHFNIWSIPRKPRYPGDSKNYHVWTHHILSVEEPNDAS